MIMRKHGTLAQDRPTGARGPGTHDRTIAIAKPEEVWFIDATSCLTDDEGTATLAAAIPNSRGTQTGAPRLRPALQQPLDIGLIGYQTSSAHRHISLGEAA
jgi:hypothetical protein